MAVSTIDALYNGTSEKLTTSATGITVTGNATFADNGKAIFGAGSDLQIYHDGSASRIVDVGTGSLKIQAENFAVNNVGDTENMITATPNDAVSLFYDGSAKLATTATGLAVTGEILQNNNTKIECINSQGNVGDLVFSTRYGSMSEKLRMTSLGKILIARTTSAEDCRMDINHGTRWGLILDGDGSGTDNHIMFNRSGGTRGYITSSSSSVSYSTTSDYRLKENVVDLTGASARVNQLNPSRFNFIADDTNTLVDGFLAHEVATVVPEAITGAKDEVKVWKDSEELPDGVSVGDNKLDDDGNTVPVYQGIDQSKLVPLLTAALQEALAEITSLKTRVEALEA